VNEPDVPVMVPTVAVSVVVPAAASVMEAVPTPAVNETEAG
jgi:hypothetical protein